MAPKRKRRQDPKRACPCCGSLLSEKTIARHALGTHVPTRINVTLATAAAARKRAKYDSSSDNGLISDLDSEPEIHGSQLSDDQGPINDPDGDYPTCVGDDEHPTFVKGEESGLKKIIHDTWSGTRSRVDEYESDEEDQDFEENSSHSMADPDSDMESDFEGDGMGFRNGLAMEDLVDEDLQRIIAEFCELFFHYCYCNH